MMYKATTFISFDRKDIPDGHSEVFNIDYHITINNVIKFKNIFGTFKVIRIDINLKTEIIELLCSPIVHL